VSDFLRDQTSGELAGWLAYLRVDDEAQAQRTAIAMMKAFGGAKAKRADDDEDEPVIDTTDPKFAQTFKGFINAPGTQRNMPVQKPQRSTEIIIG